MRHVIEVLRLQVKPKNANTPGSQKAGNESMNFIEEINLPNGLTLRITDFSRRIAADTIKVEIVYQMKVGVSESFFASREDYQSVVDAFGPVMTYEHKTERTFVHYKDEASVRDELLTTFKQNKMNYLASPNFAKKMALSTLREIKQNPFKYQPKPCPPETEE
jgi:hypothetical protein